MGLKTKFSKWKEERQERQKIFKQEFERAKSERERQKIVAKARMMAGYQPKKKIQKKTRGRQPPREQRVSVGRGLGYMDVSRGTPAMRGREETFASLSGNRQGLSLANFAGEDRRSIMDYDKKKKRRGISLMGEW